MEKYYTYINDVEKIIYKKGKKDKEYTGINYRKIICCESNLMKEVSSRDADNESKSTNIYRNLDRNSDRRAFLGTVLHFDADLDYLKKCEELYKKVGVYCFPILCHEVDLESEIKALELKISPDVIVITGHDYYNGEGKKEINNYTNSKYFCEATCILKKKYPDAIIIAGACQSNYEALIAYGASFASSPKRINVHVYDPAIIAITICTTHMRQVVNYIKMGKYIQNLTDAYGGIETYGKMKLFY